MKTNKNIKICLDAGFVKAFFEDDNLHAMFENGDEMVVIDTGNGFKAWVLDGPFQMRSPKSITRENKVDPIVKTIMHRV